MALYDKRVRTLTWTWSPISSPRKVTSAQDAFPPGVRRAQGAFVLARAVTGLRRV